MKIFIAAILLVLFAGCGEDNPALSENFSVSKSIIGAGSSVMGSIGGSLPGALAFRSKVNNQDIMAFDDATDCDNNGNPEAAVVLGDKAAAYFYCKLMKVGTNPESPRGAMNILGALMCVLEKQVALTFPTTETSHSVTVDHDNDSCLAGLGETGSSTVIATQKATGNSDWQYYISLKSSATDTHPMHVYIRSTATSYGAKVSDWMDTNTNSVQEYNESSAWSFIIDSASGEFRFEQWDARYNRHLKIYVDGTVTPSGAYSSISSAKMAYDSNDNIFTSSAWDGTNESYEYMTGGYSDETGYPKCNGDCSGLETIEQNASFIDFCNQWLNVGLDIIGDIEDEEGMILNYANIDTSKIAN